MVPSSHHGIIFAIVISTKILEGSLGWNIFNKIIKIDFKDINLLVDAHYNIPLSPIY